MLQQVEIVSEGDMCNELVILVAGSCVVEAPRLASAASDGEQGQTLSFGLRS